MLLNRTKAKFKCHDNYKPYFSTSTCSLTISVGQPNHETDKLNATIALINNNFKSCNIMVCDTLQRHTMAIHSDENTAEDLYDTSLRDGDQWILRNKPILDELAIEHRLTRWDFWLKNPGFSEKQQKIINLYKTDLGFKQAMDNTIQGFYVRLSKRGVVTSENFEHMFTNSFNYLAEECAIQLLWIDSDYEFEIYPAERNEVLSYCYETYIKPFRPHLLRPVALKFKSRHRELACA